jgi:hypothetical protein
VKQPLLRYPLKKKGGQSPPRAVAPRKKKNEEYGFLGCNAVWFGRNPPTLRLYLKDRRAAAFRLPASFLPGLLFDLEEGGDTFLRNVDGLIPYHEALQPRRSYSSKWKKYLVIIKKKISYPFTCFYI